MITQLSKDGLYSNCNYFFEDTISYVCTLLHYVVTIKDIDNLLKYVSSRCQFRFNLPLVRETVET